MILRVNITIQHLYYFLSRQSGRWFSQVSDKTGCILIQSFPTIFYNVSLRKSETEPGPLQKVFPKGFPGKWFFCRLLPLFFHSDSRYVTFLGKRETTSTYRQKREILLQKRGKSKTFKTTLYLLKSSIINLSRNFNRQKILCGLASVKSGWSKYPFEIPGIQSRFYTEMPENKTDICRLPENFFHVRLLKLTIACLHTTLSNSPGFLNSALPHSTFR